MNLKVEKTLKIVSNIMVIIVVVVAFLLHGIQLFGLKPYSVLSGSMESVYPTGSLIYVVKINPVHLEVNDIITFKMTSGTVATHRIVELVPDEFDSETVRFRTKGDENKIADGTLVEMSSVIGKPIFCIPFLGYFATYIIYPPGKYIAITVVIAFFLVETMISLALDNRDKKKPTVVQN